MNDSVEHCWEKGWQGHEEAQLRRMARWSLRDKILWLEEAARVVERISKQDNARSHSELGARNQ